MKNTKLQNPSLRKRKGFTLIELIVVIAILAILAAIAIPTFIGQLERARKATHNANIMSLRSAAAVALAENGNPGNAVTWTVTTNGDSTATATGDAADTANFVVTNYMDTWPTLPSGLTYTPSTVATGTAKYTVVISANGSIDVSPVKITS